MRWTDALVEQLKTLLGDGLSSSQIGEKLGRTRNAIIGKVHRMGLALKNLNNGQRRNPQPRHPRRIKVSTKSPNVSPPLPMEEAAQPCTLFDLKYDSCKWPVNDGVPEFMFCGKPQAAGQPYCETHAAKAYSGQGKRI
jgi:GcrA cell cycle regulator